MSAPAFTPPPWHCGDEDESALGVHYVDVHAGEYCTPSYRCVASVEGPFVDSKFRELDDETRANANLIAAAPELYDGCNAMLGLAQLLLGRDDLPAGVREALTTNHRIAEAQAATAKARGEAA